ncbi:hypothetical protein [Candidatus Jidaibacter acanthamoebae]|uniref:hypothetical protein n=1 Tax=Candidatus Jidaibacter acanthamoebae TaxID=86105 RepID=UPI00057EF876|nr:hypothetical protein [Candidatus Jidaibacter acanthamoeba]
MATNQNPFEELLKQWTEQTQKFTQDPQVLDAMTENFLKLQKNILNFYENKDSSSPGINLSHDILNAIVKLSNRVNELEERIRILENNTGNT